MAQSINIDLDPSYRDDPLHATQLERPITENDRGRPRHREVAQEDGQIVLQAKRQLSNKRPQWYADLSSWANLESRIVQAMEFQLEVTQAVESEFLLERGESDPGRSNGGGCILRQGLPDPSRNAWKRSHRNARHPAIFSYLNGGARQLAQVDVNLAKLWPACQAAHVHSHIAPLHLGTRR
jgi:hypothetical protein